MRVFVCSDFVHASSHLILPFFVLCPSLFVWSGHGQNILILAAQQPPRSANDICVRDTVLQVCRRAFALFAPGFDWLHEHSPASPRIVIVNIVVSHLEWTERVVHLVPCQCSSSLLLSYVLPSSACSLFTLLVVILGIQEYAQTLSLGGTLPSRRWWWMGSGDSLV